MKDTSGFCRIGVGSSFWEISNLNYQKYEKLKEEFARKCNPEDEYSVLENSELEYHKDYARLIAIVFAAMYLESEIYTYLACNLTDSFAQKHLDRLDPLSKWVVGVQLITGKSLPKDEQAYELCKNLFSYRNKIVHHKSRAMESNEETMVKKIVKSEMEFDQAVHISNRAVRELAKVVGELHDGLDKPLIFVSEEPPNNSMQPIGNRPAN